MYLMREVQEMLNLSNGYFLSIIRELPYWYKTKITSENKQKIKTTHWQWVIDKKDLPAFLEYWDRRTNLNHQWTRTARECYEARLVCQKCINYQVCSGIEKIVGFKPIKKKVIELVKELGIPPERIIE